MATILETTTILNRTNGSFALTSTYSGEQNPGVSFLAIFTVTDNLANPLESVELISGDLRETTDVNGEGQLELTRGAHTVTVSLDTYISQDIEVDIINDNVAVLVELIRSGDFDQSYDESFTN